MKVKDLKSIIDEPHAYIYIKNNMYNLIEWDENTLFNYGDREVLSIYGDYRIEARDYIDSFVVVEIDDKA